MSTSIRGCDMTETTYQVKLTEEKEEKGTSLWMDSYYRLRKNKMAVVSFFYLILQSLAAIFAPLIAPFSYAETNLVLGAVPPDAVHWLGTDDLGRDLFTRTLYGARVSLAIGVLAVFVSVVIGITYGAISGFVGGRTDYIMQRLLEILYAMPFMLFVIILMVMAGRNIYVMFIALGAIQWLPMARIVRGQVIALKRMEYVDAARAIGVGNLKIIFRHMVPNVMGPVIIFTTLTIPSVILEEAFLSFLGLGVQEPMSSWGTLINDGVAAMDVYPWMLIFPCTTLIITLLAFNFLGDGLRDALDPKVSKH